MPPRSVKVKLNPDLLVWARESAGYSPARLAEELGVTIDDVVRWESGGDSPTFSQLERLAGKVKRPLAALFLPYPPTEPPPPRDFRLMAGKITGRFEPETLLAFRRARNLQDLTVELADVLGSPIALQLPRISLRDDPEEQAARIRSLIGIDVDEQLHWKSPAMALRAWRDTLFDFGVLVFQFPIPKDDARGFCIIGDKVATIGLSTDDREPARIFSLFHDLCHICLGAPGVSGGSLSTPVLPDTPKARIERFCDRFAGAYLLPLDAQVVRTALRDAADQLPTNPQPTLDAARRFKVSKYVVLRRMLTAGLIQASLHWSIFNEWEDADRLIPAKAGGRGGPHPADATVAERGRRLASLILEAFDRGVITTHDAGQYLALSPKWFDRVRERAFAGGGP